jgi:uncharacterized protein
VLDSEPVLDVPGMTTFALAGGGELGLMPEAGIERILPGLRATGGLVSRAELYLQVEDPAAFHRRALQGGAVELSPLGPRAWGDEAAYCRDADGHVLAFARPA